MHTIDLQGPQTSKERAETEETGKEAGLLLSLFFFFNICMLLFFFPFIFISWRLITLLYCSGFCHILT